MDICVCIGSSCHLKGSHDVIKKLEELIEKHGLKEKVVLKGNFCLGHCDKGVTVKVNNHFLENVNKDNIEEKFLKEVLPLV